MADTVSTVTADPGSGGADLAFYEITTPSAAYAGVAVLALADEAGGVDYVNSGMPLPMSLATLPDTAAGDLAAMVVDLAAIEVLLTTIDADTSKIPALGTALAAASVPVVLASDHSDVKVTLDGEVPAVSQSGVWNITNISGTVSLPTGAATAANQATANASLTNIEADTGLLVPDIDLIRQYTDSMNTAIAAIQTAVETIDNPVGVVGVTAVNRVAIYDDSNAQIVDFATQTTLATLAVESGGNLDTIAGDTTSLNGKIAAYTTDDLDSGTGTDTVTVVGLALPGAGGHVVGGTSTNPVRTDPTGTTTQPVSGTVTANAGTGTFTVDNAGTFAVQAAQSGTWNITNVSGTISLPTGAATAANQSTINTSIANMDTALQTDLTQVQVDTAHLAFIRTAVEVMDDWDETDRCKVNPIAGQAGVAGGSGTVGATTQRVVLATDVALPTGTNAIGKLAANSGVDIGDVDVLTQPARDRLTDNIGVAQQTDVILSDTTALTPKFAVIDAATSGDNTIVAAVAGKKIRVIALFLVASADVTIRWESGASGTALSGQMQLVANSGFTLPSNIHGWFETASNTLLNLELSGAISVDGHLTYIEV